ncbi:DNA polymerase III subunit gamma and tau [Sphaerisporangium sp. TRM90804]|uniref:DNA polymerase III subunit gamma and tau n=1 Tax=Sphaerisporangium sp. TRM90804 TaxID=3031113 RepID=UPI00244A9B11|nr:DNA polymerase III subunit gamma and tau [Sphaerisporangium sp. TRM90804]MDH2425501.1 DNA polymerase III subunit gamma and tau [Sphaerisporangium sp. TRM90804]
MSLALYRKYRPETFAEVKGQDHVTEPLRQALSNGRVNHAYLFSGPRGCGKTSSARILARSLNCEKGPTPDPCGVCESCVALAPTGPGHLDVIEIDAASHGGVDDARDLRERAFFAPVSARFKIYIIDEAHMVTREGFNALLKLVEEPPPHLKFVFATTEPEKVIGTIKSRTHHYPFRLMPPATLRQLLVDILESEAVPYEATALPLVVRAGAGSARDSLSVLDQLLSGAGESGITYARAVSLLGYTDGGLLDEIITAFARRDGAQVFQAVNRVVEGGHDPRRFAMDVLERFRDLVVLANVPDAVTSGLLDRPADELERLAAQAASMGPAELTRAAEVFNAGLTEMRGATSPRLLLELMCARVLLPAADQGEAALVARLERLERGGAAATAGAVVPGPPPSVAPQPAAVYPAPAAPAAEAAAPRPASAPSVPPAPAAPSGPPARDTQPGEASKAARRPADDWPAPARAGGAQAPRQAENAPAAAQAPAQVGGAFQQAWPQIVDMLRQRSPAVWANVKTNSQLIGVEGDIVTLGFSQVGAMRNFVNGGKDSLVAAVIGEVMGGTWRVEAVVGNSGGPTAPSAQPQAGQPQAGRNGPAARPATARPGAPAPDAPPPARRPAAPAQGAPQGRQQAAPRAAQEAPPPADEPWPEAPQDDEGPGPVRGLNAARSAAQAAAQAGPRQAGSPAWPDTVPGRPSRSASEADEVDPVNDADADSDALSGMALVERELGGKIIEEIDHS